jgi:hypothetical protein
MAERPGTHLVVCVVINRVEKTHRINNLGDFIVAKKLTGTDIMNTINIDIHAPVIPNNAMKERLIREIENKICKANVAFYTERGNAFEIMVYNGDLQEKEELQKQVMNLYFNFLYQNH